MPGFSQVLVQPPLPHWEELNQFFLFSSDFNIFLQYKSHDVWDIGKCLIKYVYRIHRLKVFVSKARMPKIGKSQLVMFPIMLPHWLFNFNFNLKPAGYVANDVAPPIVGSRALAVVAFVACPSSVPDCPAWVVAGVRSSQIATDATSLLSTFTVVGSSGHVPNAFSCGSTAQFARPLARLVSHGGAGNVPPLPSSW